MIIAMREHHVVHDPTLVTFEAMAWGDSARVTQSPDLAFAEPSMVANWRKDFSMTQSWKPQDYDSARAVWPAMLRVEKVLFDRGVLLTAGTDANNPWTGAGASFHRELELLVSAGIGPLDVLTMATRNGAEGLGILDEVGTITVGKRADLVLLTADPVAKIGNTRRIAWVMLGGRLYAPAEIRPDN